MTESNVPPPPAAAQAPVASYETPIAGVGAGGIAPANKDDQNMGLLMFILGIFTGFLGPLILWLVKKEQSQYINEQGKELLNWQITVFIAFMACAVLAIVIIGFFLIPVVAICNIVFTIIGAVTASKGQFYRFPFAIRLLK
jgi:uncharacterized Tic20 family protein